MPDRVEASPLLVGLVKRKQLGTKTGAGIYAYPDAEPSPSPRAGARGAGNRATGSTLPAPINPVLRDLIDRWRPAPQQTPVPHSTIADCLLTPMREEADNLLAEGVVSDRADINQAMIHGLGIRPAERC